MFDLVTSILTIVVCIYMYVYAGRKLKAARCSVRHRSRQNVYVIIYYRFNTVHRSDEVFACVIYV